MSVRTDTVNLNINVNGNKAQNDLNNLRKKAADVKFEMEGLKKGTAEYIAKSKELGQISAEMTRLKKEIGITALTQKELVAELNKLKSLRGSVIPFSNEYKELSKSIKEVENRLYNVRNGVQGFSSFFSKIKDEVKQFGVLAAGYLGFQFITTQFTNIIRSGGKLSDQLADLRRVAGLTAEEASHLNAQFKELDSRTSAEGLRNIAIIAGKLGVAKEDIFEFTKAVDQLVVTLGDELGDADQITTQLGKILNVFDGEITGDNISRLGNAFVELANTGAATGGFIADFDQRLSGVAKSAGISLGALSGLGAGLEEMGARVESSATAVQKLIISIASDIPAAAKIAGLSAQEFDKLFKEDATEALLRYSEGLVKNKKSFAEITASLKDAGEEGARTIETISKLGTGADQLRRRIDLGKKSIQENSAITEAFALKNETFGATLDKLGKEFNRLVTSPGVINFLQGAVEGALAFVKALRNVPQFIQENKVALLTLLAGVLLLNRAYIASSLSVIKDTAVRIYNTTITKAAAIAEGIATRARLAAIIATDLFTGKIKLAAAAQQFYAYVLAGSLGPIGILITLIGALGVAFALVAGKQGRLTSEQKAANELAKEASQIYGDQVNNIQRLQKILEDETASLQLKQEAYKQLIALHPDFEKTLTLDEQGHLHGADAINIYVQGLKNKAEAQAAAALSNKTYQEILEKQAAADQLAGGEQFRGFQTRKGKLLEEIKDLEKRKAYYDNILNKNIVTPGTPGTPAATGSNSGDAAAIASKTIASIKAHIQELDKAYESIDISNKKALVSNRNARKALQDQLDALEGKKTGGGNSEYERLKKEAEKFYKDIQNLKKRIDKGNTPEEQEVQRATQKYEELLLKAKEYYLKKATSSKKFNEEEKIIEEQKQQELNEIFEKYFKKRQEESAAKEYDESLTARREFSNQLKIQAGKDYADGKLSKSQYAAEIKQIDKDETHDRIIIAEDYSKTVKKAATDVKEFRKKEEQETTDDIIKQAEARVVLSEAETAAKLRRGVLTTRPGSAANLAARKAELKYEEELEVQAAKDKYAALGILLEENNDIILTIRADFNQQMEELDHQHTQTLIDNVVKYVGYFQQALTSLNQVINNKENAQFNKEKALNNKKRKEFKAQLDNKLISQAQYDKKINELQEEQDRKERELKRKQAKREKALNLFRAIVNVAAGVASSLSYGGPVGIALAAITAVLGALEIAAIASQPLPEAGKGKYFGEGDKHSDASGGIPIKVEKGEAVITAAALDDDKQYQVTGTPKQITSALNSQAGGVNWAGGAIVKRIPLISDRPARINPGLPAQLAQGGIVRDLDNTAGTSANETNGLLRTLITEQQKNTEEIKNMKTKLHAIVSIKEYREEEKRYDASQKLSGLG